MKAEQPRIEAVIWDVDGVLIDSEPLHYLALTEVCARDGRQVGARENQKMLGLSLPEVWAELNRQRPLGRDRASWCRDVVDAYLSGLDGSLIRPGVGRIVERLAAAGIPQAAVSTAERRIVEANLAAIDLRRHMATVVAREDVMRTKPDPAPYLLGARRLGVVTGQCLAVEDSRVGLRSARRAGLVTIGWPHAMSETIRPDEADYVLARIDDFPWWPAVAA